MNDLGRSSEEGDTPVIEIIEYYAYEKVQRDTRNPVGTNKEDHLLRLNTL